MGRIYNICSIYSNLVFSSRIEQLVEHWEAPVVRDEEVLRLQAEHDWADGVIEMVTDPTQSVPHEEEHLMEQVWLLRFSRTPREFNDALECGPELAAIRERMTSAGCAYVLRPPHAGAKVFVWPEQYKTVLDAIDELENPLFSSNVVILQSLIMNLEDVVANIPRRANVHEKERRELAACVGVHARSSERQSKEFSLGDLECVLAQKSHSYVAYVSFETPSLNPPQRRTVVLTRVGLHSAVVTALALHLLRPSSDVYH